MPERVLVVDDGQEIREFLAKYILKPKGFEVIQAGDGIVGLRLALVEKPDLLITDNQMPGLSGLEVIRDLRGRGINIPIILTTAYGSEETAVEAFRLGVRDYVIKPFDTEEINTAIERALKESRLARERDELVQKLMATNSQLEKRYQEMDMLYGIGKSVTASLNLEEVLQRVVEAAAYITNAEEGSLMLLDEKQGELYMRASKNLEKQAQSMRLAVRDSLAGRVMETKKPLVIGGESQWQKIKTYYLVKSLMYIPLVMGERAVGVLGVSNRQKDALFDRRDARVLAALADYATIAIQNASLYTETDNERNKISTILSQTDDPVLLIDDRQRLLMVNNAARSALQLPEGELLGRPLRSLTRNKDMLAFAEQQPGRRFNQHGEINASDGRVFNANMTVIEGVGRSIVLRDVTQLKELDRLKSEFVSVVSHDLRSPLTAILGYVQLLERAGSLNEMQKEFVNRVQASVANITSLIGDLLDLGRLEAGLDLTLAPCLPDEILLELVEELQPNIQAKQLRLNLDMPEQSVAVTGDRNRLHQAFGNLLGNAIKYTPDGGRIGLRAASQDGQIIIQVSDTGVGIAPADQPYIFDKFFRAENVSESHEGTGLGLSIVKSVVERHYGRVWVTSELGKGTTFTVVLPTNVNGQGD
jgi:two-component system phosphate regulon sensor histidine kinase PhoR